MKVEFWLMLIKFRNVLNYLPCQTKLLLCLYISPTKRVGCCVMLLYIFFYIRNQANDLELKVYFFFPLFSIVLINYNARFDGRRGEGVGRGRVIEV